MSVLERLNGSTGGYFNVVIDEMKGASFLSCLI